MRGAAAVLCLVGCSFHGAATTTGDATRATDAALLDAAVDTGPVPDAQDCSGPCFRRSITIPAANIGSTTLGNFPFLVALSGDTAIAQHARPDGFDIAFADAGGTRLDYERQVFDKTSGKLLAWVHIPSLVTGADYTLYMSYGDAQQGVDQQKPTAVWPVSQYAGVWHLDSTPLDSTTNAGSAQAENGLQLGAPGVLGNGSASGSRRAPSIRSSS